MKVMTTPMEKRMDRARLPAAGDGQAGEGTPVVGPDFPGMGFLFGRRRFADQR